MLGQFGFLARVCMPGELSYFVCLHFSLLIAVSIYELGQVFSIFEDLGISVDCVATSEVSVSVSLDPSKIWSRELIQQASASVHMLENYLY
jgi:hypothetical protein